MAKVIIEIEDIDGTESGVRIGAKFDPAIDGEEIPESTAQKIGMGIFMNFANAKGMDDECDEDIGFLPPSDWEPD